MSVDTRFIGTWGLVSFEVKNAAGETAFPFGEDAVGRLAYDAKGGMAVQVMRRGRPPFESGDHFKGGDDEIKAAFEGFVAYFGTFDVQEVEGTVTHRLDGSLLPNWIGTDQVRYFEFAGDTLTLKTPPVAFAGSGNTAALVWRRM